MTQYSVLVLPMIALAMLIFFPHTSKNSKISASWKSRRKRKVLLWRLTLAVLLIATVITLAWRWEGFISLIQGVILAAAVLVPALVINAFVSLAYKSQRIDLTGNSDTISSDTGSSHIARDNAAIQDDKPPARVPLESYVSRPTAKVTPQADARSTESIVTLKNDHIVEPKRTQQPIVSDAPTDDAPTDVAATDVAATKVAPKKAAAFQAGVQQAAANEHTSTAVDQTNAQVDKGNAPVEPTSDINAGVRARPAPAAASQQRVKRRTATSTTDVTSLHESTSLNPDFDNVEITLFEDEEDSPAEVQEQLNKLSSAVQSHDLSDWKESATRDNKNWKHIRDSHDRQTALSTDLITSVSTTTDISKLDSQEINQLVTTLTKDKLRLQKLVIAQQAAIESERQSHDKSRTVARDAIRIMRDARDAQKMAEKLARRERTERKRIEQQYKSVASALDNALSIIETRKKQADRA